MNEIAYVSKSYHARCGYRTHDFRVQIITITPTNHKFSRHSDVLTILHLRQFCDPLTQRAESVLRYSSEVKYREVYLAYASNTVCNHIDACVVSPIVLTYCAMEID